MGGGVNDGALKKHAQYELERAGLFGPDSDYGGLVGRDVMEVMDVLEKQQHSGGSIGYVVMLVSRLAKRRCLTPLTSDPEEWVDVSEQTGQKLWQNRRDPSYFSRDGGKNMYCVDEGTNEEALDGLRVLKGLLEEALTDDNLPEISRLASRLALHQMETFGILVRCAFGEQGHLTAEDIQPVLDEIEEADGVKGVVHERR